MAAALVQHLGSTAYGSASTTTVLSPSSKTVTAGNTVIVGIGYNAASGTISATDNLGNTYTARSNGGSSVRCSGLLSAPVTTGGTITTITVTHPSATYRAITAAEFSGVGAFSEDGGATYGNSTTATWVTSKTIPANGLAVGVAFTNAISTTHSAGSASGSPSTGITMDNWRGDSANLSSSFHHAIAGGSDVTSFSGTATFATDIWEAAGATFSPDAPPARAGDIYELESGGSYGYQLEDASGVLLIDASAALTRTAGDSVATLTEATARAFVGVRAFGDSVGTLSEAVARGAMAKARTSADSLGSLSEAVSRVSGFVRTSADSIGSLSEAAVRAAMAKARTGADSVTTLTETAVRSAMAKVRSVGASANVVTVQDGGPAQNEIQQITVVATGGTWTLTLPFSAYAYYGVTSALGWDISAAALDAAIDIALDADNATTTSKVGNVYTVEFDSSIWVDFDLPLVTTDPTGLTGDAIGTLTESAARALGSVRSAADSVGTLGETAVRAAMAKVRTAGDSVGSLSEVVARMSARARTAGDSVATLAETVARAAGAYARTSADSVGTLTETVSRSATAFGRAAGDSISTLSEAVARGATAFGRAVGDSISALSEVVVGVKSGAAALVRTAADSLATLAETVARGRYDWTRTSADSVGSLSETVARSVMNLTRSAGDAVGTLSESVSRGALAAARIAGDTVATLSEAVVRLIARQRSVDDSLGSLSETVARMATFGRSVGDSIASIAEAVVASIPAFTRRGRGPLGSAASVYPGGAASPTSPLASAASVKPEGGADPGDISGAASSVRPSWTSD